MASLAPFQRNDFMGNRSFANILDDYFSDDWLGNGRLSSDSFKIDVRESGQAYNVEAELPGVKREEITLSLYDGQLVIAVTRDDETRDEDKDAQYIYQERRYTSMSRSVYLPGAIIDGVTASLQDGVLQITVPKAEKSKAQQYIKIG